MVARSRMCSYVDTRMNMMLLWLHSSRHALECVVNCGSCELDTFLLQKGVQSCSLCWAPCLPSTTCTSTPSTPSWRCSTSPLRRAKRPSPLTADCATLLTPSHMTSTTTHAPAYLRSTSSCYRFKWPSASSTVTACSTMSTWSFSWKETCPLRRQPSSTPTLLGSQNKGGKTSSGWWSSALPSRRWVCTLRPLRESGKLGKFHNPGGVTCAMKEIAWEQTNTGSCLQFHVENYETLRNTVNMLLEILFKNNHLRISQGYTLDFENALRICGITFTLLHIPLVLRWFL